MNAILKSGSASLQAKVRPLGATARTPEPPAPDPEVARLGAALAAADLALARHEETIAAIPAGIEAAFAEGEAQGRKAAEDGVAARLALLSDAAERALALYGEEMASLERLAALLAQTCLDRMLIGSEDRARIVADLLRARLAALDADAIVRILVSAGDFPSPEALEALAPSPCEIVASSSLAPGDCTVQLRLGALEIGIGQQWGVLRDALGEMAA
jgi:flagellar biosynthesis/type III secretory pathway protein FliH